jgi:hypothetical protein
MQRRQLRIVLASVPRCPAYAPRRMNLSRFHVRIFARRLRFRRRGRACNRFRQCR